MGESYQVVFFCHFRESARSPTFEPLAGGGAEANQTKTSVPGGPPTNFCRARASASVDGTDWNLLRPEFQQKFAEGGEGVRLDLG